MLLAPIGNKHRSTSSSNPHPTALSWPYRRECFYTLPKGIVIMTTPSVRGIAGERTASEGAGTDVMIEPVEQRTVVLTPKGGDEVLVARAETSEIYLPIWPIYTALGINWATQYRKIKHERLTSYKRNLPLAEPPFHTVIREAQGLDCALEYHPLSAPGLNACYLLTSSRTHATLQENSIPVRTGLGQSACSCSRQSAGTVLQKYLDSCSCRVAFPSSPRQGT